MASIAFKSVSRRYGPVKAVTGLDLACASGEMLALLGPSGCGKSTTLKMAAGIEDVTAGEIWFGDRRVTRLGPGNRNIAMAFEDYALYPHMGGGRRERRLPPQGPPRAGGGRGAADRRGSEAPEARGANARGLSAQDAYTLCSLAADLRVTQMVDGNKGVHCVIAKDRLPARRPP